MHVKCVLLLVLLQVFSGSGHNLWHRVNTFRCVMFRPPHMFVLKLLQCKGNNRFFLLHGSHGVGLYPLLSVWGCTVCLRLKSLLSYTVLITSTCLVNVCWPSVGAQMMTSNFALGSPHIQEMILNLKVAHLKSLLRNTNACGITPAIVRQILYLNKSMNATLSSTSPAAFTNK